MRLLFHLVLALHLPALSAERGLCRVEIVEAASGWPLPLVELRTTHQMRFVSDNAGIIALDAPEIIGRETWFSVIGHGYDVPQDGFGYRGVRLTPEQGKTLRVEVIRGILAIRIGRLRGAGLYAESQKLAQHLDWHANGIHGCDNVQNTVHRGRLFWAKGDTILPNYPLGIFDMSSATTAVNPMSSLEPPLEAYESGLCAWNDASLCFDPLRVLWRQSAPALFFEGTYTKEFAQHVPLTPRYDYNPILYRLDLDDPGLLPAAKP